VKKQARPNTHALEARRVLQERRKVANELSHLIRLGRFETHGFTVNELDGERTCGCGFRGRSFFAIEDGPDPRVTEAVCANCLLLALMGPVPQKSTEQLLAERLQQLKAEGRLRPKA
jgi:hypothetical protein